MAEVTRVPLQPIEKGSLTKLWLGVLVAILLAGGVAWAAVPKGVELETITAGNGPTPGETDVVFVKYVGKLADGTEFDRSQEVPLPIPGIFPEGNPLPLEQMVPGFRDGAMRMQKGGKYTLYIPADQGYGASPPQGAPIPPNSDLVFEVEMIDFMTRDDFQQRIGVLQQMMQESGAAMGQGGEAGAPAGDAPAQPAPQQ